MSKPHRNRIALHAGQKRVCPTEFGGLAPVFEKSVKELKLKQKVLKCKRTIEIATFKVRTLNRIGQQPELTATAMDHNRHNMHTRTQIPTYQRSKKKTRYRQCTHVDPLTRTSKGWMTSWNPNNAALC